MWVATRGKVTNDSPLYLIVPGVGHVESASPLSAAWPTVRSAIRSLLDGQLPS